MKQFYLVAMLSIACSVGLSAQEKFTSITFRTNLNSSSFNGNSEINFHRSERFSWGWQLNGRFQKTSESGPSTNGLNRREIATGPSMTYYKYLTQNRKWMLSWNFSITFRMNLSKRDFVTFGGSIVTQKNNSIGPIVYAARPAIHFHFNERWSMLAIVGEAFYNQNILQRKSRRVSSHEFSAEFYAFAPYIGFRYRL
ncbi:MAG: hypothetical protein AAF990_16025 [Bacteroidota bacterium]